VETVSAGPPKPPSVGDTLNGKYRLERLVGEGGMALVYEATHLRLGQRVAIKVVQPHVLAQTELVERFAREARAAGQLRSPNTARVFDVDTTPEGIPYLVMEFLDGEDLAARVERDGPLPIAEAVDCVLQAAKAMTEAHEQGIIHRDLKPSNLFLSRHADGVVLKVLDFGISKVDPRGARDVRATSTLAVMGTPLYMSPEQIRSSKNVDARTDVWSLGIVLYELLTGATPFQGTATAVAASIVLDQAPSVRSLRPDLPPALEAALARAIAKSPADRWQSMKEMAAALAPFGSGSVSTGLAPLVGPPQLGSSSRMAVAGSIVHAPTVPIHSPDAHTPPPRTQGNWSAQASVGTRTGVVALAGITVAIVIAGVVAFTRLRGNEHQAPPAAGTASGAAVLPPDSHSVVLPAIPPSVSDTTPDVASTPSSSASASPPATASPSHKRPTPAPPTRTSQPPSPPPPTAPPSNPLHI
jgi:serine/threonine-protein kinase